MDGLLLLKKKINKKKDIKKVNESSYQVNKNENKIKDKTIKEEIENKINEKIKHNESEKNGKINNIYQNLINDKIEITNQTINKEKEKVIDPNLSKDKTEKKEEKINNEKIEIIENKKEEINNQNEKEESTNTIVINEENDKNKIIEENNDNTKNSNEIKNNNLNENIEEMENKSQLVNDDYFQTENGVDDLIEKKMENLKELINSNIELEEKLNKIILQIEKEEEEFQPISEKFNLEISKLDNTLSKLFKDNKKRFNELTKIKTQVNGKYSRINPFDFPKMAFKRKKKINEIIDYSSYKQLTNIKNKQIDNLKKSKNNIEKEISNIESFIKINLYSKNNLDETYNLMIFDSKIEELKVKLFELNHKLINLKKEVKELQLFYSKHSECEIIKKKYLEILERTKIEYLYLVHNQNKSELRRIDVGKIKEKILTKKKHISRIRDKKKIVKKIKFRIRFKEEIKFK